MAVKRQRKYRRGRRIKTVAHLTREILAGRYVCWYGKPMHPGWMASQRLSTLSAYVARGAFHLALRNEP